MPFAFDHRPSDSPFVDVMWHTQSEAGSSSFTSLAEAHWGLVVTKQYGKTVLTMRGPETFAIPAPIPEDAEFFGIIFKLGTFMPHLPNTDLVDGEIHLPEATSQSFYLQGSAWQFPNFENADTFVNRLIREGLIVHEPLVDAVLKGELKADLSLRSVQRRFLHATGLTHGTVRQIERAHKAAALLRQGVSILDTVYEAGYADQPHLTRSLKLMMGQTPAQLLRLNQSE